MIRASSIARGGGRPACKRAGQLGFPIMMAARRHCVASRPAIAATYRPRWMRDGERSASSTSLSVSGLHLAVVAGLLFALLRRLAAASPWGGRIRPARWAAPPAILSAIAYTMITGGQLATVRALIVVVLALGGQMLDRPLRLVDALGAAAIVILAWRPADLWDPSFQLSFVAALTLAVLPRGTGGWLARGFRTSLWVAITTAPLTAFHFHQVAAGGVVGNLVLTPLVELVALPLALAGLVLHVAGVRDGRGVARRARRSISPGCSRTSYRSVRSPSRLRSWSPRSSRSGSCSRAGRRACCSARGRWRSACRS